MKKINVVKFGLMILLGLMLFIEPVVSLGIPTPFPTTLRMMRGDTTDFKMNIQATNEIVRLSCNPYVDGFEPLIITFKEMTVTVEPGEIETVWGTVTIPSNAPIKTYEGMVHATCVPVVDTQDVSGSKITKIPGNTWSLSVVSTEAERNIPSLTTTTTTTPTQEVTPTPTVPTSTIITIIIIIAVLAIGVNYWLSKKGKKKK